MLEIVVATLAAVYLYARWAVHRSERWHDAGLCAGCGAEAPQFEIGGNHFCEPCAPAARRNYQVGGQFFAFMGSVLGIFLLALLLSGGGEEPGDVSTLRIKVGVAAAFFLVVAWWIHRGMKRKRVT